MSALDQEQPERVTKRRRAIKRPRSAATIAVAALVACAGGYLAGRAGGGDRNAAILLGTQRGHTAGEISGFNRGYAAGLRAGERAGYHRVYRLDYGVARHKAARR
ncbi:MAG: hypothetical protein M3Z95_04155 [Actinomycetota bacterium]|nr:hypothetical protein [Actinomycetota bacterium]